jgi:predicted PurR-regulated permease PerM
MRTSFRLFTRENLFAAAFIVILLTLLWLVFSVLEPFWADFIWALILALTLYPVFSRLKNLLRGRGGLSALVLTFLVFISLVLPGSFILINLGQEAKDAYHALSKISISDKGLLLAEKIRNSGLQPYLERWGIQPEQTEALIWNGISSGLRDVPKIIGERVSAIFKNLAIFGIHLLFVMVALFFFFRDGPRYARFIVGLLPLERAYQERAVGAFSKTVTAVVRGMLVTALAQGILAGAGFTVVGLPVPILLGLLTAINSFIPFLGAASVWLPASIWLIVQEEFLKGIGLGLYGLLIISIIDNFIKPMIIGESTKIPVFLLFFTILGGLKVYGVLGIFLGPIILSLGMAFLTIYREIYLSAPAPKTEHDVPPAEPSNAEPQE